MDLRWQRLGLVCETCEENSYPKLTLSRSKQNLSNEFHAMIDLDIEKGRDPSTVPEGKRDLHRVAIRKSATVDLNNIYAYLNGQVDFGPGVIDAISKCSCLRLPQY